MDPISTSSGVITLLFTAQSSCKFLCNFFHNLTDAPIELQRHSVSIRALEHVLSRVITHPDILRPAFEHRPEFVTSLQELLVEIGEAEESVRELHDDLVRQGRMRRVVATLKWTTRRDERLKRFLDSVSMWNTVLSYELNVLQIELLRDLQTARPVAPASVHEQLPNTNSNLNLTSARHHLLSDDHPQTSVHHTILWSQDGKQQQPSFELTKRCLQHLHTHYEAVGIRPSHVFRAQLSKLVLDVRNGPILCRRWVAGREVFEVSTISQGMEISILCRMFRRHAFRISLVCWGYFRAARISFHANLSVPTIIPCDAPVIEAVKRGDIQTVRRILDSRHASLTDATPQGESLLHFAISHRQPEICALLVDLNIDVNASDQDGGTPLHLAVKFASTSTSLLLDSGADLHRQDRRGQTPLHSFFTSVTRFILTRDTDLFLDDNPTDAHGRTVLHYLSWTKQSTRDDLLRFHPSIDTLLKRDTSGRSLLHLAAERGNTDLITYFLEQGHSAVIQLSAPDTSGRSPLHYATESSRVDTIDMLHHRGLDLRVVDRDGCTVLHHAAARNKMAAVERILALGGTSDLDSRNDRGQTPLEMAQAWRARGVVELLQERYGYDSLGSRPVSPEPLASNCRCPVNVVWRGRERPLHLRIPSRTVAFVLLIMGSFAYYYLHRYISTLKHVTLAT